MSHETASEGNLLYGTTIPTKGNYVNLVKDMSWLNSKNHQHTDRDGHVIGYWVDITLISADEQNWSIYTAPNTWKMRNSFRKFHALRDLMFKEAGVTKSEMGKYGRTIRPYLEPNMVTVTVDAGNPDTYEENDVLSPLDATDAQREWTYTSLASNPGWQDYESIGDIVDDATSRTISLADEWKLTICGENQQAMETAVGKVKEYQLASMIHSYNLDRMEVVTPDAEEVISGPNNPLAALRFQGPAAGEVIDIAEDQELEAPPYDVRDDGDSTNLIFADFGRTNSATLSISKITNLFIPAGIFKLISNGVDTECLFHVDVKGWSYCRDL